MGPEARRTRRKKREEARHSRRGQKAGGADASALGDGRGVRATRLPAAPGGGHPGCSLTIILSSSRLPFTRGPGLLTLATHATRPGPRAHGLWAEDDRELSARFLFFSEERPQEVERPTAPSGRLRRCARANELEPEMSAPEWVGPQSAPGPFGDPSTSANGSAAERCLALLWTPPTKISVASGRPSHGSRSSAGCRRWAGVRPSAASG